MWFAPAPFVERGDGRESQPVQPVQRRPVLPSPHATVSIPLSFRAFFFLCSFPHGCLSLRCASTKQLPPLFRSFSPRLSIGSRPTLDIQQHSITRPSPRLFPISLHASWSFFGFFASFPVRVRAFMLSTHSVSSKVCSSNSSKLRLEEWTCLIGNLYSSHGKRS